MWLTPSIVDEYYAPVGTDRDHATILNPGGHNEGIEFVFVNGRAVVEGGALTGALPGEVVTR